MKENILDLLASYKIWIEKEKLDHVVIRIHYIYLQNPTAIDGNILGLFARRLIDSEVEAGGPYLSKDDIYTNILIMNLFRAFGTPLEKLEKFLSDKPYIPKNAQQNLALELSTHYAEGIVMKAKPSNNKSISNWQKSTKKLDNKIKKQASNFLNKIIELDNKSEISLISNYIQRSLVLTPIEDSLEISYNLGSANISAWIAYTIYDDFIDEEGSPEKLSLANIMHRFSYSEYIRLFPSMIEMINQHYNSVDGSNLWELENCRAIIKDQNILIDKIPDYGKGKFLADRSIGHVLGPKLLINLNGLSAKQSALINGAFDHYLIAKQINDDLRDWRYDLRKGHLNYVISMLLRDREVKSGKYNTETLIKHLKENYWNAIYEKCLRQIIKNLIHAEDKLRASELFIDENIFIDEVLEPLKNEVESLLRKHSNEKQFLKTFSV